ncbi:LysM-like peptidoglycan-binding domain-containing protein [Escherichia coli]|uniref:LysM-like peptidoglycan-binding domain-containing protein n=1 Tax=Escherichia coli TaxID=562 RepID=UPI00102DD384|nr:OapA family protein [Escherichia coli]EFF3566108.1 hypothetical protein [Escherichia coli]EKT3423329.1 OapA family protein [Escherichia coli]ELK0624817.1 OapA family protein [Escherichia coli]RZY94924.1 hypothetical protein EXX28_18775 [Escherichia coli]
MPGRFELKPTLVKIWHAPDNFRLMDPLPPMHRRGIIIAAIVLIIGILLPGDETRQMPVVTREAQLDMQSPPPGEAQLQAHLVTPQNDPDQVAPVAPEPIQEGQPEEPPVAETQSFQPESGIDQQWRTYRVELGKTLAQLFRDHNLPPTDVYAMAQVEGADKPLSNLQNGQIVKIRQNANGVVTGLTIDTGNNQQVLFTRQPDGNFIRAR